MDPGDQVREMGSRHVVNTLDLEVGVSSGWVDDGHKLSRGSLLPLTVRIVFVDITVYDLCESSTPSHSRLFNPSLLGTLLVEGGRE